MLEMQVRLETYDNFHRAFEKRMSPMPKQAPTLAARSHPGLTVTARFDHVTPIPVRSETPRTTAEKCPHRALVPAALQYFFLAAGEWYSRHAGGLAKARPRR
jgi:hypothetical protein